MKKNSISIESGLTKLTIKSELGEKQVAFNPTDVTFVGRLFETFEKAESNREDISKKLNISDIRGAFKIANEADKSIRKEIDDLLGAGTCNAIWGNINAFAYSDGFPLWVNLLISIIDLCDESVILQQKLTSPRMEKYTKKYQENKAAEE